MGETFASVEAALEKAIREYSPPLAAAVSRVVAESDLNALFIQMAHLVWGKKWSPVFPVKDLTVGEPTDG